MIEVSIIIVNYNTTKLVKECIDSINALTNGISYEIIVVDNMSQDRSIEEIAKLPKVKLIKNSINYGFGKANNIGVKNSSGEYIFLLNSDTLLLNNAIKLLYDSYIKINKIGALGTILKDINMNDNYSYGTFPTVKNIINSRLKYYLRKILNLKIKEKITENIMEVDFVTGAALFIKKSIFEKSLGFDENIFMYYEETDLQFQLKKVGYKNFLVKGPNILHYDGGSWGNVKNTKRIIADRSMFYYFKKNNFKQYLLLKKMYLIVFMMTYFQYTFAENRKYLKEYRGF
ncbi:MAG: glycosyltransferase family 2 protein [Cetobacterium sp.]